MEWIVNGVYLVVAVLFVVGLKAMSSPVKPAARRPLPRLRRRRAKKSPTLFPYRRETAMISTTNRRSGGCCTWG